MQSHLGLCDLEKEQYLYWFESSDTKVQSLMAGAFGFHWIATKKSSTEYTSVKDES